MGRAAPHRAKVNASQLPARRYIDAVRFAAIPLNLSDFYRLQGRQPPPGVARGSVQTGWNLGAIRDFDF